MGSRRCAKAGCRAWAMRRELYCVAHRRMGELVALERVEVVDEVEEAAAAFREGVLAGERERLVDARVLRLIGEAGTNRGIDTEVGALRLLLLRALAEASLSGDLERTALTVVRLTDAIGRLLKVRQVLEGGRSSQLEQSLYDVLRDMGLGEPEGEVVEEWPEGGGFAGEW